MKKLLPTIVITAVITSICWKIAMEIRDAYNQTWLISAVKAPGRMALEEIETDLRLGNISDATTKLQIFKSEWRRFQQEEGVGLGIGNVMVEFSRAPAQQKE